MLKRPDVLATDELRILTVTWNIAGKAPKQSDISDLIFPKDVHHDLYVVGSQEALSSIMGSIFKPNKEAMNQMIQECLGEDFIMVGSVSLQATHLVVFAHMRLIPMISKVVTDTVATGWGSMMGNKGAVKLEFIISNKRLVFINAHMHSGQNGVSKRNNDVDIVIA